MVIDYACPHLFGAFLVYYVEAVVEFYSFEASCEVGCLPVLGAGLYFDSAAHSVHISLCLVFFTSFNRIDSSGIMYIGKASANNRKMMSWVVIVLKRYPLYFVYG